MRNMVRDTVMNTQLDLDLKNKNPALFEQKLKEGTDELMGKLDQNKDDKVSLQELEVLMIPLIHHMMSQGN